jgi:glycosyltransferase involved in cell wall biosynthesis
MNVVFVSSQHYPNGMAGSKRIKLFAEFLAKNNKVKVIINGISNGGNQIKGNKNDVAFEFNEFSRIQTFTSSGRIKKILSESLKPGAKNILFLYDGIGLTNFLYAKHGKKLGYKVIVDIVEDYSKHSEKTGFLLTILHKVNYYFERRTFKFADGVIVLSNRLFSKFSTMNREQKLLTLIPVSAENLFIEHPKEKDETVFTFIYSGSYGVKDGVSYLVEAFDKISALHRNTRLILAGQVSEEIKESIKTNPSIINRGLISNEEYYSFISQADVLLMTRINSEYANTGFPFKLGEYLATGNTVIATKVSDVELYLKDKEDIILAEPSSVNSLVTAMQYAVDNQSNIKTIGSNGRKRCAQYFNPRINGEKLTSFLERL